MAALARQPILPLFLLLLSFFVPSLRSQQPYVDNRQLECYNKNFDNLTLGFHCNSISPCQSYVTFRSQPPYSSATSIASLLNANASQIQSLNNLSSDAAPHDKLLIVPVNCSCAGRFYQHNTTYRLAAQDTYFIVANNTFQGLSTCQALMSQNSYGDRELKGGENLVIPIRCACPTDNQTAAGFKYLVTYLVTWKDSISALAQAFNVTEDEVKEANGLTADLIFPFTTILIPIKTEPVNISLAPPSPLEPARQPPPPGEPAGSSSNKRLFVYLGIGIGAALVIVILLFLALFYVRRGKKQKTVADSTAPGKTADTPSDITSFAQGPTSWSSSKGFNVHHVTESLTLYLFEDLQAATDDFAESNRIKGSAYKGWFKGDNAVVKVMKGDVSSEINLLKMLNHSRIVRLSGYCVCYGNTYLVYEWVENGSLSDWIHNVEESSTSVLTWKQRVEVAGDIADALDYLHNYTNPSCIHKNLTSSNVLLDSKFRAKIANFGLARSLSGNTEEGNVQLTRHVVGTQGYMPPEYVENGVITSKFDVFAFGVILLELLSGKEAAKPQKDSRVGVLHEAIAEVLEGENVREKLKEFMDPSLGQEYPLELAFAMAQLAKACVAPDLNARPPTSRVLEMLSMIVSATLDWDPSRSDLQSISVNSEG